MLTKLKRSALLVELQISFHLRRSGPEKLNLMPQRSKPKLLNTMVGTQLLLTVYMAHSRDPTRPVPIRQPTGLVPSKLPTRLAHSRDSTRLAHSKNQLTSFSKSENSQPIASGPDVIHTPAPFSLWGLLWQLWLSYPLCASVNCTKCLCTWTKSRIVQSPTKLNDKI